MYSRRLGISCFAGVALAATLGACTQADKVPSDGGTTGSGGISGGGGISGTAGVSGTGGLQPPRSELWPYGDWVGQWPATTDGTTPSQFAGKTIELVIYQADVPFTGSQLGYGYKGSITFDTVGPLTLQRVGSSNSSTASYAWWLYSASYEQLRVQGYQDANNRISLTSANIGARGVSPSKISFDTWSITINGVTEASGSNPLAPLIVLTKQ